MTKMKTVKLPPRKPYHIRLSNEERRQFQKAAVKAGLCLADWIRSTCAAALAALLLVGCNPTGTHPLSDLVTAPDMIDGTSCLLDDAPCALDGTPCCGENFCALAVTNIGTMYLCSYAVVFTDGDACLPDNAPCTTSGSPCCGKSICADATDGKSLCALPVDFPDAGSVH